MVKSSVLFNINDYLLLEYIYNDQEILSNQVGFRKLINEHEDSVCIVNQNNLLTKNNIDNSVVLVKDGYYYLMDSDGPNQYTQIDNKIKLEDITISPNKLAKYDKVRIHILSGYRFGNINGFLFGTYIKMTDNKKFYLSNLSYTMDEIDNRIYDNPNPLKISSFIYDKFVEFNILSLNDLLDIQNNIGIPNNFANQITSNRTISNQNLIYFEFNEIQNIRYDPVVSFLPNNTSRFSLPSVDNFSDLVPIIEQEEGHFKFFANWKGNGLESFIYRLNSTAGSKYYVIHDIVVSEQIGSSFTITQNINSIQTENFDNPFLLRPICLNAQAVSLKLDYIIRIHNAVDGRSIFKTSTKLVSNPLNYYKDGLKIQVANTPNLKVYNQIEKTSKINLIDNIVEITKSKVITQYINVLDIKIQSNSDQDPDQDVVINLTKLDNFYRFQLLIKNDLSYKTMELKDSNNYFMVFIKNDSTKKYINENLSDEIDKLKGEISFKISSTDAIEIQQYTDKTFYIISKVNELESVIAHGKFVNL
jgi:hypothetical protein